ncbi:hypothetical protein BaRGS_00009815 [Batillaria attramentaria]|uniref:Uncharacterized protein n=1 Tax=Batillaria attramentaria TaxID=370345 RepID=A0ABD0LIF3_9CAEN
MSTRFRQTCKHQRSLTTYLLSPIFTRFFTADPDCELRSGKLFPQQKTMPCLHVLDLWVSLGTVSDSAKRHKHDSESSSIYFVINAQPLSGT